MSIKVYCPACEEPHRLSDDKAGKSVRCQHCDERIPVPDLEDERPRRSRTRRRQSEDGAPVLLIVGIVGGLVLLVAALIGFAVFTYQANRAGNPIAAVVPNPGPAGFGHNPAPFGFHPVLETRQPANVNEALKWLGEGGGRAEMAAAWLDKQPPDPAFRPQVIAALDRHYTSATVNVFGRETFLNAMGTWAGPDDVPVLVRSLDFAMNGKVLDALVRHKNDTAARGVVRKLGGLTFFDASAALKRMGPTAEDAVADFLLTTSDGTAKHEAARLLEIIGTRKSVEKMRQAMAHDGALEYQGKKTISMIQNR